MSDEVRQKAQASEQGEAVVEVCYRFSENEQFNVETFFHSAEQITGSVQEKRGEVCEGF